MARIRDHYEESWYPRLKRWLQEGDATLDNQMIQELELSAGEQTFKAAAEKAKRNEAVFTQVMEKRLEKESFDFAGNLKAWGNKKGTRFGQILYTVVSVLICVGIILMLLRGALHLPTFGNSDNPTNNEVSLRYIEQGMEETGAVNIVAGMILDYRAFDTLGESNVLFVAACTVIILLRLSQGSKGSAAEQLELEADDRMYEPKNDMILQRSASLLVPMILLFGMYVILNGHISPGGGFSGGAVMGAGLILYLNAFGFRKTEHFFTFTTFRVVSVAALSFYAISKAYSFFTGANDLHSFITPGTPGMIFSAGLIPYLNLAVGLVVCCTMYAFYTLFRKGDM